VVVSGREGGIMRGDRRGAEGREERMAEGWANCLSHQLTN